MIINVSKSLFVDLFDRYNRSESFSYTAREALYDYLIDNDLYKTQSVDIVELCGFYAECKESDLNEYDYEIIQKLNNGNYLIICN